MKESAYYRCSKTAFEQMYRNVSDPWRFADSSYERGRYGVMLRALPRACYRRAFEPGCSVGEFTALLAGRCETVIATDLSETAVGRARRRCAAFSNVHIYQADLADGPPAGPFELIVLSEIGYYFSKERWADVALAATSQLARDGQLLAVHWLGYSEDHILHGDEVHGVLHDALPLCWLSGERHEGFRLDSWQRT